MLIDVVQQENGSAQSNDEGFLYIVDGLPRGVPGEFGDDVWAPNRYRHGINLREMDIGLGIVNDIFSMKSM